MTKQQKISRVTHTFSRAAEYFDAKELRPLTGQNREHFAEVVLKELLDNALDAAEAKGDAPRVDVWVAHEDDSYAIQVTDNGVGVAPEVVGRIMDFETRTSDKVLYRTPSRGQQGNALKTILGIPWALGDRDPLLIIESRGVRHEIRARLDGQTPEVSREMSPSGKVVGTTVTARVPADDQHFEPGHMIRSFALFNPHVDVSFHEFRESRKHAFGVEPVLEESHSSTDPAYRKFKATDPLVAHWFDEESFYQLVRGSARQGADKPIGEFVGDFRGFSDARKRPKAREGLNGETHLSHLSADGASRLLEGMKNTVKEPSHGVLAAPLGKTHILERIEAIHGITDAAREKAKYKKSQTTLNGAPAIVEALVVDIPEGGDAVYWGINHSPTFKDPLSGTSLVSDKVQAFGVEGFLRQAHIFDYDKPSGTAVVFHITAAAALTLDRGKATLAVAGDSAFAACVARTLMSVVAPWWKAGKRRERDLLSQWRAEERDEREASRRISKLEACYEVMEEAYAFSTGNGALPTMVRDLYYAVRNRIERFGYDADELGYNYFSQTILPAYRREVRELPRVHYDPRGTLHEPHGDERIELGTRSVAEYNFPEYKFDKILYIEKKGRVEILQAAGVDNRHDMAIIGGQGYATEAVRRLFETAEEGDYQLFVLHDADPHGYGIARTLREETARMPDYSVEVIDLGLHLEDALALGKRPETFTRKNKIDEKVESELTDVELEHFVGAERTDKDGKRFWISRRVELNDLSSPELVEYVEKRLAEAGASGTRGPMRP